MGKYDKLLSKILGGQSDANIEFSEMCQLLRRFGFAEEIRGSHHTFRKEGIVENPNLQSIGSKCKAYQVKQVRTVIIRYSLER